MLNNSHCFSDRNFHIFYIKDKYDVRSAPTTSNSIKTQDNYINPKFRFYVFQDFIKRNKDKTRQLSFMQNA